MQALKHLHRSMNQQRCSLKRTTHSLRYWVLHVLANVACSTPHTPIVTQPGKEMWASRIEQLCHERLYPHLMIIRGSSHHHPCMGYLWSLNSPKLVIAARQSEGNYKLIAQDVLSMMAEYNTVLCQQSVARSAWVQLQLFQPTGSIFMHYIDM